MHGTLMGPGHKVQRSIFILKRIRAAMGWAVDRNPDAETLEKAEFRLRKHMQFTRRPVARDADQSLLAITKMTADFIDDPSSVEPDGSGEFMVYRSEAKRLARRILSAATPDPKPKVKRRPEPIEGEDEAEGADVRARPVSAARVALGVSF